MDLEEAISHSMLCIGKNFQLKGFQKEVIRSYTEREDVFCVAGTGAGKSITFALRDGWGQSIHVYELVKDHPPLMCPLYTAMS